MAQMARMARMARMVRGFTASFRRHALHLAVLVIRVIRAIRALLAILALLASHDLDGECHRLAAADADRRDAAPAALAAQCVHERGEDAGAACTDRMSER